MVSGESGTGSFAEALVQESPLVRMAQQEQKLLKNYYSCIIMKAMRMAEDAGVLPEGTCDKVELQVEAPPMVVRDMGKETQRNETLRKRNIISDRTWTNREDLDYEQEHANMEQDGDKPSEPSPEPGEATPSDSHSDSPGAAKARLEDRPDA